MEIKISKRDIIWNYFAQIFNLGAGVFVLPVVLRLLSPEEVGMNYLMLTVSSFVALADFGFSQQFGRNITYVFSGARNLKKEGVSEEVGNKVDYHLLAVVIETARYIYQKISVLSLLFMLSFGTLYMFEATDGFSSINYSLIIWLLFCLSTYFNMYFLYYGSFLTGAAMIMESKKALILNRVSYIVIAFAMLFLGFGLISIVMANFISPFVGRWYSHHQFFKKEMKIALSNENITKDEIRSTFKILWYNAKKLGINFLGAYGIQQSSMFVIGLFLTLKDVASYGLMCQLFQVISALATGLFTTMLPSFYKYRVERNIEKMKLDFSFSSYIFIIVFCGFGLTIVFLGQFILDLINSSTNLPEQIVMSIYFVHLLLENFHSICASMIVVNNEVPFVKASLLSGFFIVVCNLLTLKYTNCGIMGVVVGQLIVQSLYNHWKWPMWVFKDLKLNPIMIVKNGIKESNRLINTILRKRFCLIYF